MSRQSRSLLLVTMGLALSLVAIVCVIVAAAFFHSPYSGSFGAPGLGTGGVGVLLAPRSDLG